MKPIARMSAISIAPAMFQFSFSKVAQKTVARKKKRAGLNFTRSSRG